MIFNIWLFVLLNFNIHVFSFSGCSSCKYDLIFFCCLCLFGNMSRDSNIGVHFFIHILHKGLPFYFILFFYYCFFIFYFNNILFLTNV